MDGMIALGFVAWVVLGVALMALALKALDVQEQKDAQQESPRTGDEVPSFFRMPAASMGRASSAPTRDAPTRDVGAGLARPMGPVPPAKLTFHDRLPTVEEIDVPMILYALEQAGTNRARAAALVGTDEATFDRLVAMHCPNVGRLARPAREPEPQPAPARQRDVVAERVFAFVQNQIWSEQAVVSEFVHLPSIDSLYRQTRPALTIR